MSTRKRMTRIGTLLALGVLISIAPSRAHAESRFVTGLPETEGPLVVQASFHLRDLNEVDDSAETFELGGVLTLRWRDPRQAFDPATAGVGEKVYLGAYQFNEVFTGWFPQVVLINESGLFEKHGTTLRIDPDGTVILVETLNAIGEADLVLRKYPFDEQRLEAVFEVLGFDATEVVFEVDPETGGWSQGDVQIPEWALSGVSASTRAREASYAGRTGVASSFVIAMNVKRESFFMFRLVIFPLMLIVMLSWSVFWMDRSSLGDRLNVSFIGILTAVAYQIVVSEIWPDISYFTLMHGFLNLSFIIMCVTVVINLMVAKLDQAGKTGAGDRVDRRCRWAFPLTYFGLLGLMAAVAFAFF